MATPEQHREISAQFMAHAEDELRKGDLLQASEKAWGAVAHYVNSVARQQNWPLGSHRLLIQNANTLLGRDPALAAHRRRLFRTAEGLHTNFYQAAWDEEMVQEAIEDAKELISALQGINAGTPEE